MTYQCNRGHANLKRNTTIIPGHTINHCPTCGSFNVEGTQWWPVADLSNPTLQAQLCRFADELQEHINRTNEMYGAEGNDPRWDYYETRGGEL
jgi:hypothetical protein